MKILITGGKGFLGRYIANEARKRGHETISLGFDDGDLLLIDIAKVLTTHEPDVVLHLAARVGRAFGEVDPMRTIEDNVTMVYRVAKPTFEKNLRFVLCSTSEVYGDLATGGNSVFLLPKNLYGLTKKFGEEVTHLLARQLGSEGRYQIVRPSMPYGPGLPPGKGRAALVNFIARAYWNQPLVVHEGTSRSWCFVEDTARGIVDVLERGAYGRTCEYDIGRADEVRSMEEVARLVISVLGSQSQITLVPPPSDITPEKNMTFDGLRGLGWEPKVALEEGLMITFRYMLASGQLDRDPTLQETALGVSESPFVQYMRGELVNRTER